MVHRRVSVNATHQLPLPVPASRELLRRRFRSKGLVPLSLLRRMLPVSPPELPGCQTPELLHLRFDFGQEFGVFECIVWVEARLFRVAGEEKEVERRFGEEVVDRHEVVCVVHYHVRRVRIWVRNVFA